MIEIIAELGKITIKGRKGSFGRIMKSTLLCKVKQKHILKNHQFVLFTFQIQVKYHDGAAIGGHSLNFLNQTILC